MKIVYHFIFLGSSFIALTGCKNRVIGNNVTLVKDEAQSADAQAVQPNQTLNFNTVQDFLDFQEDAVRRERRYIFDAIEIIRKDLNLADADRRVQINAEIETLWKAQYGLMQINIDIDRTKASGNLGILADIINHLNEVRAQIGLPTIEIPANLESQIRSAATAESTLIRQSIVSAGALIQARTEIITASAQLQAIRIEITNLERAQAQTLSADRETERERALLRQFEVDAENKRQAIGHERYILVQELVRLRRR